MQPLSTPRFQAFKDDGSFAVGWKAYFYSAGTSTPLATYTDQSLATANTNPVVLDATGSAEIWLDPAQAYKVVLTDDSDVPQWSSDQIGAHATGSIWLGDANYYAQIFGGNPYFNFDANDYLLYNRNSNILALNINGNTEASVDSTGAVIATSLKVNNGGTAIKQWRVFSGLAVDPGAILTVSRGAQAVTVPGSPGIAVGDVIIPVSGIAGINDDLIFEGVEATGTDQVTFYFYNPTVGTIDDVSNNWSIFWLDVT